MERYPPPESGFRWKRFRFPGTGGARGTSVARPAVPADSAARSLRRGPAVAETGGRDAVGPWMMVRYNVRTEVKERERAGYCRNKAQGGLLSFSEFGRIILDMSLSRKLMRFELLWEVV